MNLRVLLRCFPLLACISGAGCIGTLDVREAFLVGGDQRVVLQTPALSAEQEVVVYIGECQTRKLAAITEEQTFGLRQSTSDIRRLSREREVEEAKSVHVVITAHSVILEDKLVVPMHNAGLTALGSFRTNSRFVLLRVDFPEEHDHAEAIVDISRGRFVVFDRAGSRIDLRQSNKAPTFM